MTEFQLRCARKLDAKKSFGAISTATLAYLLDSNNVAIVSAMRSLERQGLAGSTRSDKSRWASLCWFLTKEGIAASQAAEERK
ncbi:hypothetical protein [Pandoraea commovens]|uniref:MarR family transcriptional regulator n=1 Tax=Pandoraea commovens TaxID=2508289 RepID=A0A5E4XCP0_9BURK|nr:hypothetical protein [Pandoraea commovens]VVE33975.1 hypothetical protein PCO31010_03817 [Pandoraea commovens]